MNPSFKTFIYALFFVTLLYYIPTNRMNAQQVTEPPVPVYIVCPYHQDSIKNTYEHTIATNGSALAYTNMRFDTLQMQAQQSSAENTVHFTWLYALVALLGTMNIVLLFSTSRIRKEIAQLRRFEHQQKLVSKEH